MTDSWAADLDSAGARVPSPYERNVVGSCDVAAAHQECSAAGAGFSVVEQANGPKHRQGGVTLLAAILDENVGLRRVRNEPESDARQCQELRFSLHESALVIFGKTGWGKLT